MRGLSTANRMRTSGALYANATWYFSSGRTNDAGLPLTPGKRVSMRREGSHRRTANLIVPPPGTYANADNTNAHFRFPMLRRTLHSLRLRASPHFEATLAWIWYHESSQKSRFFRFASLTCGKAMA
jgi:hypothetical protein